MCLNTEQEIALVATNDIVCYKAMLNITPKSIFSRKRYRSPYLHYVWVKGKLEKSVLDVTMCNSNTFNLKRVDAGLHAYVNYDRAATHLNPEHWASCDVVVKCIIPKGAEYYIGLKDDQDIVSNKMMIVEEIKIE